MRIASANLLHGLDVRRLQPGQVDLPPDAVDLEAVAAWLADLDADVIALQEVDRAQPRSGGVDQVAWLAERLGCRGVFTPALAGDPGTAWTEVPDPRAPDGGLPPDTPAYGIGLLSRVGLADVVRTPLPGGGPGRRDAAASPTRPGVDREPRAAVSATLDDGTRVTTTHLSYMPWRAVHQLGRAIAAAGRGHHGPAVLIGDLNLPMRAGRIALRTRGMHPWRWPAAATPGRGWAHLPADATYPAWDPRLQLDQAYVRDLPAADLVVGARGPSDHLPLILRTTG